jgi:hypothetical protein
MQEVKITNLSWVCFWLFNIWVALIAGNIGNIIRMANAHEVQTTASVQENPCNANLEILRECCAK